MAQLKTVSPKTLKTWLERQEAVLIDVREPEEYSESRIQGAHLVPLSAFDIDAVPSHYGKKLVFQCKSGKRSETACGFFSAIFPEADVWNLDGGIQSWADVGLKVEG